ncbi:MAG: hypothetical protein INQ03_15705 [Candidatus Heimdallarchaeota archaeon]|nr:hypothetical protein [Candidatus Heimdallarchaeota archaeon]
MDSKKVITITLSHGDNTVANNHFSKEFPIHDNELQDQVIKCSRCNKEVPIRISGFQTISRYESIPNIILVICIILFYIISIILFKVQEPTVLDYIAPLIPSVILGVILGMVINSFLSDFKILPKLMDRGIRVNDSEHNLVGYRKSIFENTDDAPSIK